MLVECMVIAKLSGVLDNNKTDVYKFDCFTNEKNIVLTTSGYKEVKIIKINGDLSYIIKEI